MVICRRSGSDTERRRACTFDAETPCLGIRVDNRAGMILEPDKESFNTAAPKMLLTWEEDRFSPFV